MRNCKFYRIVLKVHIISCFVLERKAVPLPQGSRNTKPMADVTKGRSQQSSTMPIPMGTEYCGVKENYSPPSNSGIHEESELGATCMTLFSRTLVSNSAISGSPHSLCAANRDKYSLLHPTCDYFDKQDMLLIAQLSASCRSCSS